MNIPNDFDAIFADAAARYGVPYTWLKAVAGAESDWTPGAWRAEPQIGDASYGLMQLLYRTAKGLGYSGLPEGLYDPETNVDLGAKLIKENITRFGDSFERVYSAYNSGSPTAYKTNSTVKAHVDRALQYLAAVEQEVNIVTPGSGSTVGEASLNATLLIALAVLSVFLLTKSH